MRYSYLFLTLFLCLLGEHAVQPAHGAGVVRYPSSEPHVIYVPNIPDPRDKFSTNFTPNMEYSNQLIDLIMKNLRAGPGPQQRRPQPVSDPNIAYTQRVLAAAGYNPGPADGIMGPRTREAMQAFARDRGITNSNEFALAIQGLDIQNETAPPQSMPLQSVPSNAVEPNKTYAVASREQQEYINSLTPYQLYDAYAQQALAYAEILATNNGLNTELYKNRNKRMSVKNCFIKLLNDIFSADEMRVIFIQPVDMDYNYYQRKIDKLDSMVPQCINQYAR